MADDFFTRFQAAVEEPAESPEAEATDTSDAPSDAPRDVPSDAPRKGWFKRMLGKD
jgi:hypothetical protein